MKILSMLAALVVLCAGCATVKTMPDVAQAYRERGMVKLAVDQDYEAAAMDYSRAIEFDPEAADSYAGRGLAYLQQREFEKAGKDFDKAVSLNSDMRKPLEGLIRKAKAEDWRYYGSFDGGERIYVDTNSINRSGETLSFYVRMDKLGDDCELQLVQVDCDTKKMRQSMFGERFWEWKKITDGSVADVVAKKYCPR